MLDNAWYVFGYLFIESKHFFQFYHSVVQAKLIAKLVKQPETNK